MALITNQRTFYVNSRDRIDGTDGNFHIEVNIPKTIDVDRVVLVDAAIPKSYYLVQQGFNTFTLREASSSATVTIPIGNYNYRSFMVVAAQALNSASPNGWTYAMSYPTTTTSADTGKYTYTVTGNTSQPSFIFTTNLFEQFGFNQNSTNTFSGSSLTSTNVIKLQSEDTLFIHSDICSNGQDDVLSEIFAGNTPSLGSITYTSPDLIGCSKPLTSTTQTSFYFSLTDENNNVLELNGLNMVLTILVFKRQDIFSLLDNYVKYKLLTNK